MLKAYEEDDQPVVVSIVVQLEEHHPLKEWEVEVPLKTTMAELKQAINGEYSVDPELMKLSATGNKGDPGDADENRVSDLPVHPKSLDQKRVFLLAEKNLQVPLLESILAWASREGVIADYHDKGVFKGDAE